jgi:hypothetical protein
MWSDKKALFEGESKGADLVGLFLSKIARL